MMNNETWKAYWPSFEQLEEELCSFSFFIAFSDDHLKVYSARLSDLLLRSCVEGENIGKTLCIEKGLASEAEVQKRDFNFPKIGKKISSKISIHTKALSIVWPYQSFTKTTLKPFYGWEKPENPLWFKAYNAVKHDRINKATEATLKQVIDALGGLFILNLWLRETEITKDSEHVELAKKRITAYSLTCKLFEGRQR